MKVTFSVGMNIVGSFKEETFTLQELGIDEYQSKEEIEKAVEESYKDWLWDNITGGFDFVD